MATEQKTLFASAERGIQVAALVAFLFVARGSLLLFAAPFTTTTLLGSAHQAHRVSRHWVSREAHKLLPHGRSGCGGHGVLRKHCRRRVGHCGFGRVRDVGEPTRALVDAAALEDAAAFDLAASVVVVLSGKVDKVGLHFANLADRWLLVVMLLGVGNVHLHASERVVRVSSAVVLGVMLCAPGVVLGRLDNVADGVVGVEVHHQLFWAVWRVGDAQADVPEQVLQGVLDSHPVHLVMFGHAVAMLGQNPRRCWRHRRIRGVNHCSEDMRGFGVEASAFWQRADRIGDVPRCRHLEAIQRRKL
jgi:hypothetical protein